MRISLFDIQEKYGGFIADGKLVLQCPFHGRVYPTAYIWEDSGEIRAKCKLGCKEDELLDYFLNFKQKVYYNGVSKNVIVVRFGFSTDFCKERHVRYITQQLNQLMAIKKAVLEIKQKLEKIWKSNICISIENFWEIKRAVTLMRFLIRAIKVEQNVLKDALTNYKIVAAEIKSNKKKLTDDIIEEARNVPVELLYDFKNGRALCPFHYDTTPSLVVWKKHNLIHCFGCNKTWDAISFVQELKQLSFKEAVLWLIDLK